MWASSDGKKSGRGKRKYRAQLLYKPKIELFVGPLVNITDLPFKTIFNYHN